MDARYFSNYSETGKKLNTEMWTDSANKLGVKMKDLKNMLVRAKNRAKESISARKNNLEKLKIKSKININDEGDKIINFLVQSGDNKERINSIKKIAQNKVIDRSSNFNDFGNKKPKNFISKSSRKINTNLRNRLYSNKMSPEINQISLINELYDDSSNSSKNHNYAINIISREYNNSPSIFREDKISNGTEYFDDMKSELSFMDKSALVENLSRYSQSPKRNQSTLGSNLFVWTNDHDDVQSLGMKATKGNLENENEGKFKEAFIVSKPNKKKSTWQKVGKGNVKMGHSRKFGHNMLDKVSE